jgi:hypothetical protein
LQNCNSTPYSVAGPESPKEKIICLTSYDWESFRGINAVRSLSKGEKYTLDKVIDGYDMKLSILRC